jgi:hypothetical protein
MNQNEIRNTTLDTLEQASLRALVQLHRPKRFPLVCSIDLFPELLSTYPEAALRQLQLAGPLNVTCSTMKEGGTLVTRHITPALFLPPARKKHPH